MNHLLVTKVLLPEMKAHQVMPAQLLVMRALQGTQAPEMKLQSLQTKVQAIKLWNKLVNHGIQSSIAL